MTKNDNRSIEEWLKRRSSWDQVIIPGYLVREIIAYIDELKQKKSKVSEQK